MNYQLEIKEFCNLVRKRSEENKQAVDALYNMALYGQVMSILRQELDSMIRCIYLLYQPIEDRKSLINQTLTGKRWQYNNGRIITDKNMVEIANNLQGWTKSVYKFGCAFIHLSNFHDYENADMFTDLDSNEKEDIKQHTNHYHGYDLNQTLTFLSIKPYLSQVFMKVYGNLECYISDLENNNNLI